jgi:hypothetical protein
MASIASLTGEAPPLAEVAARVARHFARVFDRELAPLDPTGLTAGAPLAAVEPEPAAPAAGAALTGGPP